MKEPGPGDVIAGRYRIEERLGAGGMGIVFRATQIPLDRPVALKLLRPGLGDARARARFEREARVASALAHPSAVAIHDFGEADGRVYIAMELLRGTPLRAPLEGGPLALERAIDLGWQIADVLSAAHPIALVHRDLKPENVFLEPAAEGERVRVVDFGLAFIGRGREGSGGPGRLTAEGVVTGTPEYLSPEQARGAEVGPATDVYALGCMLYEMLTGRLPFAGTEMEVLTRQMFAPAPPLREAKSDVLVPTALEALVMAMLRKRADERPPAEEVRSVLGQVDPERARSRERARDDTHLLGRAARMVTAPPDDARRGSPVIPEASVLAAVVGAVEPDLLLALAANGIAAFTVSDEQPAEGADVVYAPGASVDDVARLAALGPPVITDASASDMDRIARLLRAGASEVAVRPAAADELVRRIRRAVRKHARGA